MVAACCVEGVLFEIFFEFFLHLVSHLCRKFSCVDTEVVLIFIYNSELLIVKCTLSSHLFDVTFGGYDRADGLIFVLVEILHICVWGRKVYSSSYYVGSFHERCANEFEHRGYMDTGSVRFEDVFDLENDVRKESVRVDTVRAFEVLERFRVQFLE